MDKQTIKNHKLDIEAMLNCLDKAIEKKITVNCETRQFFIGGLPWQMISSIRWV